MDVQQQQRRITRFIQLCRDQGLKAVINTHDETIDISNESDVVFMKRPFSDFESHTPPAPTP